MPLYLPPVTLASLGAAPTATPTFSGLITNSGGQIAFPAVQVPSAGANVLDDYEEGTFTPTLTFGGAAVGLTTSAASGRYTKIGRLVVVQCVVNLSAKGSSTGAMQLGALPFAAGTAAIPSVFLYNFGATLPVSFEAALGTGQTTVDFYSFVAGAIAAIDDTQATDTSSITLTVAYAV